MTAGRQQRRPRTTAWKEARRCIEWRARWLQLRMKGLQHTRQRHEAALRELRVGSWQPAIVLGSAD